MPVPRWRRDPVGIRVVKEIENCGAGFARSGLGHHSSPRSRRRRGWAIGPDFLHSGTIQQDGLPPGVMVPRTPV